MMIPDVAASMSGERPALLTLLVAGVCRVVKTLRAIVSSCMANWRNIVPNKMKPALLITCNVSVPANFIQLVHCAAQGRMDVLPEDVVQHRQPWVLLLR